jgi:hypothetical protein
MTKPGRRGFSAVLLVSATFSLHGCSTGPNADDAKVIIAEPPATETKAAPKPPAEPVAVAEAPAESEKAPAEPVAAEGWGTLKGRVILDGNAPEPAVLVAKGDDSVQGGAVCSAKAIVSEKLVVNPENQGIRYAIVYIPKPSAVNPEALSEAQAADVVFDQKGCKFTPHVLAALKGTKVAVNSSDPVTHNINIKLPRNKANLTVAPGVTLPPVELKNAEVKPGEVVCDIHTWMKAYWLVLDSPYFAVTDRNGNFTLKNVPAGSQKIVVWQESAPKGFLTPASGEPVNVTSGGETTKDFTLKASDAAQ